MLRVLELYSGVGGMHFAMKAQNIPFVVVAAMDINTTANHVYKTNFPETDISSRNIKGLTSKELDRLDIDVLLMSPPCQPFTRLGKQAASNDARAESFLILLDVLKGAKKRPKFILMENVKGFEISDTRADFVECLVGCNYKYQEFLLSPTQFEIPNARLRYYLLATTQEAGFPFETQEEPMNELPILNSQNYDHNNIMAMGKSTLGRQDNDGHEDLKQRCQVKLTDFLKTTEYMSSSDVYRLPVKIIRRFGKLLDIVYPDSTNTCCFTKGYSHYVEGTGSVITNTPKDTVGMIFSKMNEYEVTDMELESLQLRYFTPEEIAKLLCFPKDFQFPGDVTTKQRYKLLGNSLNVRVVALLLNTCFFYRP